MSYNKSVKRDRKDEDGHFYQFQQHVNHHLIFMWNFFDYIAIRCSLFLYIFSIAHGVNVPT